MEKKQKQNYYAPDLELVPVLLEQGILEVSPGDSYDVLDPIDL